MKRATYYSTLFLSALMIGCSSSGSDSSNPKSFDTGKSSSDFLGSLSEVFQVGMCSRTGGSCGGGTINPDGNDGGSNNGGGAWSPPNLAATRLDQATCPFQPTTDFRLDQDFHQSTAAVWRKVKGVNQIVTPATLSFYGNHQDVPAGYNVALRNIPGSLMNTHEFRIAGLLEYNASADATTFFVDSKASDDTNIEVSDAGPFGIGSGAKSDVLTSEQFYRQFCDQAGINSLTLTGIGIPIPRQGYSLLLDLFRADNSCFIQRVDGSNYSWIDQTKALWTIPAVPADDPLTPEDERPCGDLTNQSIDVRLLLLNDSGGNNSNSYKDLANAFTYGLDADPQMLPPEIEYYCVTTKADWEAGRINPDCLPGGVNAQGLHGNNAAYGGDILTIVGANLQVSDGGAISGQLALCDLDPDGDGVFEPTECQYKLSLDSRVEVGGKDVSQDVSTSFAVTDVEVGTCAAGHVYQQGNDWLCADEWTLSHRNSGCSGNFCSKIHVEIPCLPKTNADVLFVNAGVSNNDGTFDVYGNRGPDRKLKYMGCAFDPDPDPDPIAPAPVVITSAVANGHDRIDVTFLEVGDDPNVGDPNYGVPVDYFTVRMAQGSNYPDSWSSGTIAANIQDPQTFDQPRTVSITGLSEDTQYCFSAKAFDHSELSSPFYNNYNGENCARTMIMARPPQKTSLRQVPLTQNDLDLGYADHNSARFEWLEPDANEPPRSDAEKVAKVELKYRSGVTPISDADFVNDASGVVAVNPAFIGVPLNPGTVHSALVDNLDAETEYQFRLCAVDTEPTHADCDLISDTLTENLAVMTLALPATPTPTPIPDDGSDGRGSFFSVSKNLPKIENNGVPEEFITDIDNGAIIMPGADGNGSSWVMLTDVAKGLLVYKVADTLIAGLLEIDLYGDEDGNGDPIGDGFPDILMADRAPTRSGANRCLGTDGDVTTDRDDLGQCNFKDINQKSAITDAVVGRINNDLFEDVVIVSRNRNVFDAVYINSTQDTCPTPLGPGGGDARDGIYCFDTVFDIPTPYTNNPGEKLQAERIKLAHSDVSLITGPHNIIAVIGGVATINNGEDPSHGGLRIYQNLCANAENCSAGSFVDVTDAAIYIPDPGADNVSAELALPILANDAAFGDFNGDGVSDMVVAMGANESTADERNKNLFFVGSSQTLNGLPFVRFELDRNNQFAMPGSATDSNCYSTFVEVEQRNLESTAYILVGNNGNTLSCSTQLLSSRSGSFQEMSLAGLEGTQCENGIVKDVDGNDSVDISLACGTSNANRFSSMRFMKGPRVYINDGADNFVSPDDPTKAEGDLYQSVAVVDAVEKRLQPKWNGTAFVEEAFDTYLSFGGNPDAIDGHFSAVAVGDLSGDGAFDFLWASGTKSGSPAMDAGYVQMVNGVNYCSGQSNVPDPLPAQCMAPVESAAITTPNNGGGGGTDGGDTGGLDDGLSPGLMPRN